MLKPNHKAIFYLIEPERCWHEWDVPKNGLPTSLVCSICRRGGTFFRGQRIEPPNPDFTLSKWHRKLELWLCKEENHKFCEMLWWFVFNKERTLMWKVTQAMWKNLPSLLTEFLATEECKREFGWELCPQVNCQSPECKESPECDDYGLIKRPWLRAQEETCQG